MAAHWAFIAMNLSVVTQYPDRRTAYRTVFDNINRGMPNHSHALKSQLTNATGNNEAYFWNDVWGSFDHPGSDTAHGNGVIAYVVEAHDLGKRQIEFATWTEADISKFLALFDEIVWPREGAAANYVDGTGVGTGWFSDGFVKLGRYDSALQRRLETHGPANAQFYANGALNASRLLGDVSPSLSGAKELEGEVADR